MVGVYLYLIVSMYSFSFFSARWIGLLLIVGCLVSVFVWGEVVGAQNTVVVPKNQVVKLQAEDKGAGDKFGFDVDIDGDYAIIGAPEEDAGGSNAGAAYIFKKGSDGLWSQQAKLQAGNKGAGDQFGYSVAIDGSTVVIGAINEDTGSTNAGSVYVFTRSGSSWTQQARLQASDKAKDDNFGISIDISGNTVIIGSEDGTSTISGSWQCGNTSWYYNEIKEYTGAAYIFTRSNSSWSQQVKISGDAVKGDGFSHSVAIDDTVAVIGSINDNPSNNSSSYSPCGRVGSAYIYTKNGNTWSQQAKIKATDTGKKSNFGRSVDIDGSTAIVGAAFKEK